MKRKNYSIILMPLVIAVSLCIGIYLGTNISNNGRLSPVYDKLSTILALIQNDYVDTVDMDEIVEMTLPDLMLSLDPHSSYIKRSDFTAVNDDLEGSFSGVGVSFQIINDTITVVEVITGGPAEKVGILAGDRIVSVNDEELVGPDVTNEDVFKNLRGKKDSKVKLGIKRSNSKKILTYDVIRGDIPVNSIDAHYMLSDNVGYVKVGKFARNTYQEFVEALIELQSQGASKFVVDLRDNAGGFMDQAILMANEFLPADRMIVYTKGRSLNNETVAVSDGNGFFQNNEIVVLTNEFSASASEIFAGAIQDNDRGLVVGRRSFGKGLVQNQTVLSDSSAVRLTVARYYTPSGRSIQKEYKRGKNGKYQQDIVDRYAHGEFYNIDSIKLDKSKIFHTVGGREVYGGGGIMPDIFVPEDTTSVTSYFVSVVNAGLIQKFAFDVTDHYREMLDGVETAEQLLKIIPRDNTLLSNFVSFAAQNGVPARWYYIRQSQDILLRQIKAMIVRDALGYNEFYRIYFGDDKTINRALEAIDSGEYSKLINPIK
ncbi:MAG: S41 family peptidase [Muribaculaceae bacterium]|nr:S41 family peptidase [Muribaculaceae bacterium]